MSMDFYQDARRYDLFEGDIASGNFLDFYFRQIERFGEPVLEIACGSGRLTIPLAEKGFDIKGLDISNEMLKLAEEKAKSRNIELDLVKGDMTDFDLDETFNLFLFRLKAFRTFTTLPQSRNVLPASKNI